MPTVVLPSRGININYHAFGSGPEFVVLVNGFMMTYHGWSQQVEFFTKPENAAVYTTLVFDNRGVGRSSPITGPCNVSTLALDVLALLTALKWEQFHLVGISMGGMISLEMAARAPERLKSLVLMNTHAGGWGAIPPAVGLQTVIKSMLNPGDLSAGDRNNFGNAVFADIAARKRLNDLAAESWTKLREIPRNADVGKDLVIAAEPKGRPPKVPPATFFVQGYGTVSHYISNARLGCIRSARIPTTIVVSTDDALVRPSNSYGMYKELAAPWVRLHEFQHGGHAIIMEAPDEVNRLLIDHLQQVQAAADRQDFRWADATPHSVISTSDGHVQVRSNL
eukprot:TRINITY_DN76137_c0_g1_i1.p1 TRINITY_DN76137_c0_g1~~TRINITY_DN76137_c0_g1_i1.p1  ORF type:complete len:337 (+),score=46.69 TRINITY_DN76137_c0_g1_i1:95-1105(+)